LKNKRALFFLIAFSFSSFAQAGGNAFSKFAMPLEEETAPRERARPAPTHAFLTAEMMTKLASGEYVLRIPDSFYDPAFARKIWEPSHATPATAIAQETYLNMMCPFAFRSCKELGPKTRFVYQSGYARVTPESPYDYLLIGPLAPCIVIVAHSKVTEQVLGIHKDPSMTTDAVTALVSGFAPKDSLKLTVFSRFIAHRIVQELYAEEITKLKAAFSALGIDASYMYDSPMKRIRPFEEAFAAANMHPSDLLGPAAPLADAHVLIDKEGHIFSTCPVGGDFFQQTDTHLKATSQFIADFSGSKTFPIVVHEGRVCMLDRSSGDIMVSDTEKRFLYQHLTLQARIHLYNIQSQRRAIAQYIHHRGTIPNWFKEGEATPPYEAGKQQLTYAQVCKLLKGRGILSE
jgi:hypothetical protein